MRTLFGEPIPTPRANHRAKGTGNNNWYTPARYIEAARTVLGEIDLDPASDARGQSVVQAKQFFTLADHSLLRPWHGRIWLNPPYSRGLIDRFVGHLVGEIPSGNVSSAIMLTHAFSDTGWFHLALNDCAAFCFTLGRIRFENALGEKCTPTQGQAFFYFGSDIQRFSKVFQQYGFVR